MQIQYRGPFALRGYGKALDDGRFEAVFVVTEPTPAGAPPQPPAPQQPMMAPAPAPPTGGPVPAPSGARTLRRALPAAAQGTSQ